MVWHCLTPPPHATVYIFYVPLQKWLVLLSIALGNLNILHTSKMWNSKAYTSLPCMVCYNEYYSWLFYQVVVNLFIFMFLLEWRISSLPRAILTKQATFYNYCTIIIFVSILYICYYPVHKVTCFPASFPWHSLDPTV